MPSLRRAASSLVSLVRGGEVTRRARLDTFLLDRVIRRPIVFTDDHGLRYVLYPGENAGVYIGSGGNYEVSEVRFCEQHLQPGGTLLDVGGNIGLYALLGAKLVGPAGRVHTFEPEQQNAARLRANVALNGFTNVEIFEAAVYSRPGNVSLNVFDSRFNAWHSLGRPELPDPEHSGRTVQPRETRDVLAVTLDEHCAAHALTGVDLLKIDVEGAEVDVLQGAERLLSERAVHAVMFEISLPQVEALGHASDEAFALLRAAGYECFRLRADGRLGPPVESASERYANYVALPSDA